MPRPQFLCSPYILWTPRRAMAGALSQRGATARPNVARPGAVPLSHALGPVYTVLPQPRAKADDFCDSPSSR